MINLTMLVILQAASWAEFVRYLYHSATIRVTSKDA